MRTNVLVERDLAGRENGVECAFFFGKGDELSNPSVVGALSHGHRRSSRPLAFWALGL